MATTTAQHGTHWLHCTRFSAQASAPLARRMRSRWHVMPACACACACACAEASISETRTLICSVQSAWYPAKHSTAQHRAAKPSKAKPSQAKPSQANSKAQQTQSQAKPSQTQSQAKPSQAKPRVVCRWVCGHRRLLDPKLQKGVRRLPRVDRRVCTSHSTTAPSD